MFPCLPAAEITFTIVYPNGGGTKNCYSADDLLYNNITVIENGQAIFRYPLAIECFRNPTGGQNPCGQQTITIESPYFPTLTTTVNPVGGGERVTNTLNFEWNRTTNQARFR